MDLELRRFRRDFRRFGGYVLEFRDGPPVASPKAESGWFADENGRRWWWGFVVADTLDELWPLVHSLRSQPLPPEPRTPPPNIFPQYAPTGRI